MSEREYDLRHEITFIASCAKCGREFREKSLGLAAKVAKTHYETRARRVIRKVVENEAKKVLKRENMTMRDLTDAALMALFAFDQQDVHRREVFIGLMLETKQSFDAAVRLTENDMVQEYNKIRGSI